MKAQKRTFRKLFSAATAFVLATSCFSISAAALEPGTDYQGSPAGVTIDFKNEAQLSDLKAYYLPVWDVGDESKKAGAASELSAHWALAAAAGTLQRKKATDDNPGTDTGTAMLYLNAKKYQYFEAELEFEFGEKWGWTLLCFGAQELGNYMDHNAAGVYMPQEGDLHLNYPGDNNVATGVPAGFNKSGLFGYKVRVTMGGAQDTLHVAVYAKGSTYGADYAADPVIEKDCTYELLANNPGYLSVQVQNDTIKLHSFSVKELTAGGEVLRHPGKADLQAVAAAYDTLEPDAGKFTETTWNTYKAAVALVKATISSYGTATQEQVDTAMQNALDAKAALITKDAQALADLIAECEALNPKEEDYTADSYADYTLALKDAREIAADPTATAEQISAASGKLTSAKEGLILNVDKTALSAAVEEAEKLDLTQFTPDSADLFRAALEQAKTVLKNNTADETAVFTALSALQAAQEAMVKKADKADLSTAVEAAGKLVSSQYTAASFKTFQAALASAKAVLSNENATPESVTAALNALQDAKKKLVKKSASDGKSLYYGFDNAGDMKSFESYFLPKFDMGNDSLKMGSAADWSKYWKLVTDDEGNTLLQRVPTEGVNPATETNNAMLYLGSKKMQYFEAEMTFKFGDNVGWIQLCFGAEQKGNHMYHNNAGVYMQQEGHVNMSCPGGNDAEAKWNNADGAFRKGGLHTLKLRVTAGSAPNTLNATVWADNHDGKGFVKKITKVVKADNFSDRAGYLSIQAQNDNVALDSLKVTQLDSNGNIIPPAGGSVPQTGDSAPVAALLLAAAAACVLATGKKHLAR